MISRVAERCYWMSRYLERSENSARVLDVNRTLLLDFEVPIERQWRPILIISGIPDQACASDDESVQQYMTWESANGVSITSSIAAARENARVIREVISAEMWERINSYYLWLADGSGRSLYDHHRSEFYNQVKRANQIIHGISDATMAHGEAWEFVQLGMFLERACQTARILDVKYHVLLPTVEAVGTPIDNAQWMAILMSCSGNEPYHKRLGLPVDPGVGVPEFLIFDATFPRSVLRCLRESQKAVHEISGRPADRPEGEVETRLEALLDWLGGMTISQVIQAGLHETLTAIVDRIHEIGDAIRREYFEVEPPPPTLPAGNTHGGQFQSQ
jgi:uncharacterized alpha-E superfamily protein